MVNTTTLEDMLTLQGCLPKRAFNSWQWIAEVMVEVVAASVPLTKMLKTRWSSRRQLRNNTALMFQVLCSRMVQDVFKRLSLLHHRQNSLDLPWPHHSSALETKVTPKD